MLGAAQAATPNTPAWDTACTLSGYSCQNIPPPVVLYAPLGVLDGRYTMGDGYVKVNVYITGNIAYAVTVHEMVHYLQWRHGAWTFTHENRCRMEHEALDVANLVMHNLSDKRRVRWDAVKAFYGCAI